MHIWNWDNQYQTLFQTYRRLYARIKKEKKRACGCHAEQKLRKTRWANKIICNLFWTLVINFLSSYRSFRFVSAVYYNVATFIITYSKFAGSVKLLSVYVLFSYYTVNARERNFAAWKHYARNTFSSDNNYVWSWLAWRRMLQDRMSKALITRLSLVKLAMDPIAT